MNLKEATDILKRGGVIVYPTETFYGLGADPRNPEAVKRLFEIKKRDGGKPIPLILFSEKNLGQWVVGLGDREKTLIQKHWPGPLTLVFRALPEVQASLTAGSGKIGVRVSSEPAAQQLAEALGGAITATSANLSGESAFSSGDEVEKFLGEKIDGVISGKKLAPSKGSTILDVTEKELKLIREGDISFGEIQKLKFKIQK